MFVEHDLNKEIVLSEYGRPLTSRIFAGLWQIFHVDIDSELGL